MSTSTSMQSLIREMEELINNGQFSEVENVWMEAMDTAHEDYTPFLELAAKLAKANQAGLAGTLLELLVVPLMDNNMAEAACTVINHAAAYNPNHLSLKEGAKRAYGSRFEGVGGYETVLGQLEVKYSNPGDFVKALEELCSYRIGDYLYHDTGWGLGKVVGLDLINEQLFIEFAGKPRHEVKLAAATNFFRKIPADHLLACKAEDLTGIKVLADNAPESVVRMAMRSLEGKVNLRRLKDVLVPDVITKVNWTKWWNDIRSKMVAKGMLRVGKGNNPTLELLNIPTTREDEYAEMLAACHSPVEFANVMRKYLREDSRNPDRTSFLEGQMRALFDLIQSQKVVADGDKILGKYLLDDVRDVDGDVSVEYDLDTGLIAADPIRALNAVEELKVPDYEQRFLREVELVNDQWSTVFAQAMLRYLPDSWDFISSRLLEGGEGELLQDICKRIYDHAYKPMSVTASEDASETEKTFAKDNHGKTYPVQFMWLAREIVALGRGPELGIETTRAAALFELLRLGMDIYHRLDRGERRAKRNLLLYRNLLAERNSRLLREAIALCDESLARHLLHNIEVNRALSEARIESLSAIIFDIYPELKEAEKEEVREVIRTSPSGLRKKRRELDDLQNIDIPANQQAIGEALALGDISENAELEAAREREIQLNNRVASIRRDLEHAQEFSADDVDPSVVGFGTRVKIRNTDTGKVEDYTILGRWDADSEQGIISDNSAIGRGIEGKRVGESSTFTTPDGKTVTYEVLDIVAVSF